MEGRLKVGVEWIDQLVTRCYSGWVLGRNSDFVRARADFVSHSSLLTSDPLLYFFACERYIDNVFVSRFLLFFIHTLLFADAIDRCL